MSQCNLQRIPSYMSHMHKNYEKNVYIEIGYEQILLTGTQHTRNGKPTQNQLLYMQKLPWRTATKNYMCLLYQTDVETCMQNVQQSRLWLLIFCCITRHMTCIKFCTWRAIYMYIIWQRTKRNNWWKPSFTISCKVFKCSQGSKLSEGTESKTWICVHMLSLYVIS